MRYITVLLLTTILFTVCTACFSATDKTPTETSSPLSTSTSTTSVGGTNTSGNASSIAATTSSNSNVTSSETLAPQKSAEQQQWFRDTVNTLSSLQKAGKIKYMQLGNQKYSDAAIMTEWIALLQDLEVSAVPAQGGWGDWAYPLLFQTDTETISLGSGFSAVQYINPPSSRGEDFSFNIDNYNDIKDRLAALKKEMGIPADR